MFSLNSDILRDVLTYCSRRDLNEITQATRQLNQVVQDYFQNQPFIPINGIAFMVNPPEPCADMLLAFDKQILKLSCNSICSEMGNGLGEKLFLTFASVISWGLSKLIRMFLLTSDIFRDVLTYCSGRDLNEITQTNRQLNEVVQDYSWDSIWGSMGNGLGEKLFRARRIVLLFNNGFEIESDQIRKLENISTISTNSIVSIIFYPDSFFDYNPQTLAPLGDLLNILTPKCGRLQFDLKSETPEEYSFPLLEYPALLHYNEIEFTDAFAKYLNKDDVVKFLHQKTDSQRKNPIRIRIMFPETEWAEYLMQKIVARFEQATEISAPFQLQLCLSSSVMMYFDEFLLKNFKIGEILRYIVSKDEELLDTQRHTIERAPEA